MVRKLIGKIHLWLGLSSGLLVFIIAITGCIYAFREEIQSLTQSYRYVERSDKEILPPSELKKIAGHVLPHKEVHAVLYQTREHAAKVIFYSDTGDYYFFVYINQYTGDVLKVKNENADFFRFIIQGHYYLWLPDEVGHVVVASATLIFFVMVVSGIILWWPRNKAGRKQRFRFKWKETTRWKRKNYDLHNIIGFYIASLAIVFAVTGLVWGFQWFSKGYYALISGGETMLEYAAPHSKVMAGDDTQAPAMDRIWRMLSAEMPKNGSIEVHVPADSAAAIEVSINPDPTTYWKTDYRYFDQYSLQELDVKHIWGRFKNTSNSEKLMRMNYDIHVGSILGLPGKILAFFASLMIASLPVTGTVMWWGRRNKKNKPA